MPRHSTDTKRLSEAARLRTVREALGLSQREFSLELKVTSGAVALWENSNRTIPGPVLKLIELYEQELIGEAAGVSAPYWSATQRTTKSATAALVSLALNELINTNIQGNFSRSVQLALARRIVQSLGELKGLSMKLGQILSSSMVNLPPHISDVLATLHETAAPMSPSHVVQVFLAEFGKTPRQVFAEWSPEPFAVASIGQVHRARLSDGTEVAVKVQYPKIVKDLRSDLFHVQWLERLWLLLFRNQRAGILFNEIAERILEECDYIHEAESQKTFRDIFDGHPNIIIPRVFDEYSGRTVLTTEFVEGQPFAKFIATASPEQRNRAGEILWHFSAYPVFKHGLYYADPHPGNQLFTEDKVVFLDFGRVKRFTPAFVSWWRTFFLALLRGQRDVIYQQLQSIEQIPQANRCEVETLHQIFRTIYEPYLSQQPYTFRPDLVVRTWRAYAVNNPYKFRLNQNAEFLVLSQMLFVLYGNLVRLEAKADWQQMALRLLES